MYVCVCAHIHTYIYTYKHIINFTLYINHLCFCFTFFSVHVIKLRYNILISLDVTVIQPKLWYRPNMKINSYIGGANTQTYSEVKLETDSDGRENRVLKQCR